MNKYFAGDTTNDNLQTGMAKISSPEVKKVLLRDDANFTFKKLPELIIPSFFFHI